MYRIWSLAALLILAGCAHVSPASQPDACAADMGEFNPSRDVFIGHFDSKPDVDDLHTIAAVGSLLKHPDFACVEAVGVAGAYGTQGGEYIASSALFDLAFGERWLDGHADREATVGLQADLITDTLTRGGDVWIMIAGQADIAADALILAMQEQPDLPYKMHLHLIQHSDWNESVTSPEKLALVQTETDYRKIPDGNFPGNGSPDYTDPNGDLWAEILADPDIGPLWAEAKRLADTHNPTAAYVNPAVAAGGFDFSDTAEMAHVFDLQDLGTVETFFDYALGKPSPIWPGGARAALALTYDDALNSQLENAVPQLDAAGLKATFYLSMAVQDFAQQKTAWTALAEDGHELGNHTIHHPCRGSLAGRSWLAPENDLDAWSKGKLLDEIARANEILTEMDGAEGRTYAYTCGDTTAGGDSYIEDLKPLVTGARSVLQNAPYDPYYVPSFVADRTPAMEMIAYVDQLIAEEAIGSITFHGVGGDHLWVTTEDHALLLDYLKQHSGDVWVAPLRDILEARRAD